MSKSLRTPAFWIALLALLVATSGTAYAAMVVTTKEVKDRSLLGKDLKKNTVTGVEVDENSLQVGNLNGATIVKISYQKPPINPAGGSTVLDFDGLNLRAECGADNIITLTATTVSDDAELTWIAQDADGNPQNTSNFYDTFTAGTGERKLFFGDPGDQVAQLRYSSADGITITADLTAEDSLDGTTCILRGWAIGDYAAG